MKVRDLVPARNFFPRALQDSDSEISSNIWRFQFSRIQARFVSQRQRNPKPRRESMSSDSNDSRTFRIEGSGQMLDALAKAIERALQAARAHPDRKGIGNATRGSVTIEVEATNYDQDRLRYVIDSIDDAVNALAGWAEPKRCVDCDQPVALLFDDAYLETLDGDGVICCECYRRNEDGEQET
jgi:hypothetical protein